MPVTIPRIVTDLPLQAAVSPSVWMLVIGVVPSVPGSQGPGGAVAVQAVPHLVGVGVFGPSKSATLSSVSCVPFLRTNPPGPDAGCVMPAPSRYGSGTVGDPNASMIV